MYQLSGPDGLIDAATMEADPRAIAFSVRGPTLNRRGRGDDSPARDGWQGRRFRNAKHAQSCPVSISLNDVGDGSDLVIARLPNGTCRLLGSGRKLPSRPGTIQMRFAPPEAAAVSAPPDQSS